MVLHCTVSFVDTSDEVVTRQLLPLEGRGWSKSTLRMSSIEGRSASATRTAKVEKSRKFSYVSWIPSCAVCTGQTAPHQGFTPPSMAS